jgi:hypothetical protein
MAQSDLSLQAQINCRRYLEGNTEVGDLLLPILGDSVHGEINLAGLDSGISDSTAVNVAENREIRSNKYIYIGPSDVSETPS